MNKMKAIVCLAMILAAGMAFSAGKGAKVNWLRPIAYEAICELERVTRLFIPGEGDRPHGNLVYCACHRRDEKRLREVRDEHGRIWRMRSMESERAESLMRLPRF